jgi:hypothetical protein
MGTNVRPSRTAANAEPGSTRSPRGEVPLEGQEELNNGQHKNEERQRVHAGAPYFGLLSEANEYPR